MGWYQAPPKGYVVLAWGKRCVFQEAVKRLKRFPLQIVANPPLERSFLQILERRLLLHLIGALAIVEQDNPI